MTAKVKSSNQFRKYLPWLILVGIMAVAVFFRFWRLNSLPPGLHPDEAANGLDILLRIFKGHIQVVYDTNGPRESLFFFIQAIFVGLFGNTILALRLAPAFIGVAAVFVTYLWAKDWFGRRVGLLAAAVFAINVWAITVTRDGFRASMTPLMVALVMYCGGRAVVRGKKIWFVLTGLALGLGTYTYTAFDSLSLGILVVGLYVLIVKRDWLKKNLVNLGITALVAAIVFAPLGIFTVTHPNQSPLARASGTSVTNESLNKGNPVQAIFTTTGKTLLQFNWHGDENPRQNTPGEPMLNMFVGVMFIIGIIICIKNIHKFRYFAVLAVFGTMLLPGIVSAESIPHGLRTLGAAPPAFIMAAIGMNYILVAWYRTFPVNSPARLVGLYLIVLLLGLSVITSYEQYFVAWAQDPRTYAAYSEDAVAAAKYLNSHSKNGRSNYIDASTYTLKTVDYLTHDKSTYKQLDLVGVENLPITGDEKLILIMGAPGSADMNRAVTTLKTKFPKGTVGEVQSSLDGHLLFYTFDTKQGG